VPSGDPSSISDTSSSGGGAGGAGGTSGGGSDNMFTKMLDMQRNMAMQMYNPE